ncbi:hypothetical protein ACFOGJ_15125 [Marinibaculum pumilum]|uniref:Universal stress protein n=1 Tax=Marinibaculum pumilum TaxID=1766165 RepID=A0ABV7L1U1_9PROT
MTDPASLAPPFRRIVLGFHDATCAMPDLETAVAFAQALQSELLGVFVEDDPVLEWSAAPLSRHLARASGAAVAVTRDRLAAEFATSAALMRQRLLQAAAAHGVRAGFQVERASAAALQHAGGQSADLLAVLEPADPMARLSYPFAGILRSVAASTVPVLYLPHGTRRRRGPVATLGPDGEGHRIAAAIAHRIGAPLVDLADRIRQGAGPFTLSLPMLERALAGIDESLLVLDRPALPVGAPALLADIAARRMVPVLVTGTAPVSRDGGARSPGR